MSDRPVPVSGDPAWRPVGRYSNAELRSQVREWLLDEGSLTTRLIRHHGGDFAVQRLHQGWQYPLPSEARALGLPRRQRALVREVELLCAGTAVVFARSVFPHQSLTGDLAYLRQLHNQSLGALLFRHPGMRRTPFELARIAGNSSYLPVHLRQDGDAWARRSRFIIQGKSLLVSEVFLAGFQPWRSDYSPRRAARGKIVPDT